MASNRLFLPQEAVDIWLADGKIAIEDDLLTLRRGDAQLQLRLSSALRFTEEVAEGSDPHGLVGKVKTLDAVGALEGEHYADSVVLGDNAYQVVEGFLAELSSISGVAAGGDAAETVAAWLAEE